MTDPREPVEVDEAARQVILARRAAGLTPGSAASDALDAAVPVRDPQPLLDALRRIADPTEIAGVGVTERMTGPAAVELRTRMRMAARALDAWEEKRDDDESAVERISTFHPLRARVLLGADRDPQPLLDAMREAAFEINKSSRFDRNVENAFVLLHDAIAAYEAERDDTKEAS